MSENFSINRKKEEEEYYLRRFLEILPGFLTWTTLIGTFFLAFIEPVWMAIFIIIYDLYWLHRSVYIMIFLLSSFHCLRREQETDWQKRLWGLGNLSSYLREAKEEMKNLNESIKNKGYKNRKEKKKLKLRRESLGIHIKELFELQKRPETIMDWGKIYHLIILPTVKEGLEILRPTLQALANSDFPQKKMIVVLAIEERAGEEAKKRAEILKDEFKDKFYLFYISLHPGNIAGEAKVKGANMTWAAKRIKVIIDEKSIPYENIIVSAFDCDTVVSKEYFSYLTYQYVTNRDRHRRSYQPIPVYHNNVWDAPSFARVISTASSFWQMVEAMRPERLCTFSSHSMSFKTLREVDYWPVDVISDDSRIYWRCFLHFDGDYETVPMFTKVSMDATLSENYLKTFINQYKQKRRWAWGVENFPYLVMGLIKNKKIPRGKKIRVVLRMLEGNHSWATSAFLIAFIGWIPIFFGGEEFYKTVLSYSLPYTTRTLMSLAMVGLFASVFLNLILLPPRPPRYRKWRYFWMITQWALVPFIATILGAAPAVDAQTRLMLGKYMEFWVTEKARK